MTTPTHVQNGFDDSEASEAHLLPPHKRESVIQVPVTPGVALGTYDKGYFGPNAQEPAEDASNGTWNGGIPFTSRVISATFAMPHTLEYNQGCDWELRRCSQRSALLDALHYLSDDSPWDHTVVAWTGEIHPSSAAAHRLEPDTRPAVIPTSTSISLVGSPHVPTELKSSEVHITAEDQMRLERQLREDKLKIVPIWLHDDGNASERGVTLRDQSRWRRYAEHDLCSLLHYKQHPPTDGYKEAFRWTDYCRMNQAFADKISEVYRPGDVVLVHDYYLMLLPELLRQRHHDIRVAFFLHTPFPSSELVRCLARRKQILQGVLGSDLIAFQSFDYAQHFANSCSRILGLQASSKAVYMPTRRVQLDITPAGINVPNILLLAWSASVTEKYSMLRRMYAGKKIIVAYDPIDRLGGVDKKLIAFDRFLQMYPEWQDGVVLLQVIGQTTIEDDDGEESRYASSVNALVNEINCKHGSLDHMPIRLHAQSLSTDDYFALLRSGDVALFTSIRDGMSTTSLEYVVCQQNAHGCTIISEFSGTASNLEEAIHINPWNTVGVAEQIHKALGMTAEVRRDMHAALYRRIMQSDVSHWVDSILQRLTSAVHSRDAASGITRSPRLAL
ncbi:uncharacterized protein UV8b_02585 [Ustilaginoidea virens]|uniref:Glycosyltransferase family 20 protein n=1 Tax=Ustilaginoidea virens TaxID=1159556 RepID=A0A8E5HNQ5_USTVR|nr:uncharacterized protein UV8b_02585 [Ustilaginoidea virens]QUC18344.1 hypothetical protein UV8b_02585 [Ustilaginoidea virens]